MNKQLLSLLCISTLALSLPSCRKRQEPADKKDMIETMIELDNVVFEEEGTDSKIVKF